MVKLNSSQEAEGRGMNLPPKRRGHRRKSNKDKPRRPEDTKETYFI